MKYSLNCCEKNKVINGCRYPHIHHPSSCINCCSLMQRKQTGVFVFPAVGTFNGNNKAVLYSDVKMGKWGKWGPFPFPLQAATISKTRVRHERTSFSLKLLIVNSECQETSRHPLPFRTHLFSHSVVNYPKFWIWLPLKRHLRCWQANLFSAPKRLHYNKTGLVELHRYRVSLVDSSH